MTLNPTGYTGKDNGLKEINSTDVFLSLCGTYWIREGLSTQKKTKAIPSRHRINTAQGQCEPFDRARKLSWKANYKASRCVVKMGDQRATMLSRC